MSRGGFEPPTQGTEKAYFVEHNFFANFIFPTFRGGCIEFASKVKQLQYNAAPPLCTKSFLRTETLMHLYFNTRRSSWHAALNVRVLRLIQTEGVA